MTEDKQSLSILFLASWYPSREHKTLGNFIQRHAYAAAQAHRVVVVSAHESETSETQVDDYGKLTEIRVYFKKKLPLFSYQRAMERGIVVAMDQVEQFDLAHVHVAYPAGVSALASDLPFVLTEHFSGYHKQSGFKWNYGRRRLTRRILDKARVLLPVSEHLGRAISQFGTSTPVHQVSNVVNTDIFYPAEKRSGTFSFLHISTLEERSKNITGLLRGFRGLEAGGYDFQLKIGGDGDLEELRSKISEFGPSKEKVVILEEMAIEEVAEQMRNAHCLVMFSHFENQPCTILEALCSGLPVISSDVGGIPEVLNADNGLLVPAENEENFLDQLKKMMDQQGHYQASAIADKAAALYSYQSVCQVLTETYLSVLKSDA